MATGGIGETRPVIDVNLSRWIAVTLSLVLGLGVTRLQLWL